MLDVCLLGTGGMMPEEELLGIADSVINFCSRTGIDSL